MEHLIDKDALVAWIRSRCHPVVVPSGVDYDDWERGADNERQCILSFIDTLKVEEVDLEAETRMKECPFRQIGCTMYEEKFLECTGACSWVVDYQKIKELKAKNWED